MPTDISEPLSERVVSWHFPTLEQLVDREDQVIRFSDALRRIAEARPLAHNFFEWHGGPGIGKSKLILLLAAQCRRQNAPYAMVDFTAEDSQGYPADPTQLVIDIVQALKQDRTVDDTPVMQAIEALRQTERPENLVFAYHQLNRDQRLYQRPEWLEKKREVIIAFVRFVNSLGAEGTDKRPLPVTIFFDETETAEPSLLDWIEEWLLSPLLRLNHCLLVWTARRPWRWTRPEVSRRIFVEKLPVFNHKYAKQQLRQATIGDHLAEALFANIFNLTYGHPSAGAVAAAQLKQWAEKEQLATTLSAEEEERLRQTIFTEFVLNYAFARLNEEEKLACQLLSMVRLFDTTMLRQLLTAAESPFFANYTRQDFADLLLRLKRSQLFVWNNGYALDPDLRLMIRDYFLKQQPDLFLKVNRRAGDLYADWLERPVDNLNLFVIEELYHLASLRQAGAEEDLYATLERRLQEYPHKLDNDHEAIASALSRLQGALEHDEELARISEGLSSGRLAQQAHKFLVEFSQRAKPETKEAVLTM
jgi:hypothetical protein